MLKNAHYNFSLGVLLNKIIGPNPKVFDAKYYFLTFQKLQPAAAFSLKKKDQHFYFIIQLPVCFLLID